MRPLVFKESGKIALVRYQADGTLAMESTDMVIGNGTVQSIANSVNYESTELEDGNSMFPMGVYDTGVTGEVTVTMSSFAPRLYAALVGDTPTETESDTLWEADKEHTIPDSSPYEITLDHEPKGDGKMFVIDDEGNLFSSAEVSAAGSYVLTGDTLAFHEDDAGKAIYVTYEWTGKSLGFGLQASGSRPVYHAIITGQAIDVDEINSYPINLLIDKCKSSDEISEPPRQSTPESWSFNLRVLKPRPGRLAVDWKYNIIDSGASPA